MKLNYVTTIYEGQTEKRMAKELMFEPDGGEENQLINLYPEVRYQELEGFGGAITESAGYMFNQLGEADQKTILREYFTPENMNYRMVRMPIDSCDFSLGHYEAVSDPSDTEFAGFDLTRVEKNLFPLLDAAQSTYGGSLAIMLTPWSPPAYMKTNGERNHGGKLKEEYREQWANYICHYIKVLRAHGYRICRISLQNEPKAVQPWDSCIYDAKEEKDFLQNYMWPALQKNGLLDIEVFIWDHNKERAFERACVILDEKTSPMVAGIAFHWYSGDHFEALQMIRERFPDKKLILSEACIEYSKFAQDDYLKNAQKYGHDMIGNLNHGMNGFYDWNLLLDEKGGPNHVGNYCDAPFLYDTGKQELLKRNTAAYLWHFTHFIQAGAVRIGCSNYSNRLEAVAVQNPDGTLAVVFLNRTKEEIPVNLRIQDTCSRFTVLPESIMTAVVTKE